MSNLAEVSWRPPPITTERLILRGYEPSDADGIFGYASDPEVTPFMAWPRHRSIDDAHSFLDGWVAPNYGQEGLDYAIALREQPDVIIGGTGAYWRPLSHHVMEIGYILARPHWGKGYMPEAGRALIRRVFETTTAMRIFAPIFAPNSKSRRAAEKMGLKFEGILRGAVEYHGKRWDEAMYAVVREDLAGV